MSPISKSLLRPTGSSPRRRITMSEYKLQKNEVYVKLPTPSPDSQTYISCILSKPETDVHPETYRAAMLVHGIGGHKNDCYNSKLARKLSREQGMYVVRLDFRNCGDSSKTGILGRTLQNDLEDMSTVYNWLTSGGYEDKKLFVDTLVGHSRGVVDVFNWQLQNQDKFVINLVACAGRFIGSGLPQSIKKLHPDFEKEGGHYIQGFQDGAYRKVWVPLKETESLGVLNMVTVKNITPDTDTLCVYGSRENVIPLTDAAHYVNTLAGRNTLILLPGADHCFRGVEKIPEKEWETYGKPIAKPSGVVNYNMELAEKVAEWMSPEKMHQRFYEKTKNIHRFLSRWKDVEGVANFRDIGGWNTMDGKVVRPNIAFRSAHLNTITAEGVETLRKLGVKKVFDMRSPIESERFKEDLLSTASGIEVVRLSEQSKENSTLQNELFSKTLVKAALRSNAVSYEPLLESTIPLYKPIFEHFRDDSSSPIIFHCSLGKDRTGIITILLLLLCKVDPLMVAQESALSKKGVEALRPEMQHFFTAKTIDRDAEQYIENNKPRPDWMLAKDGVDNLLSIDSNAVLSAVTLLRDKYGGAEAYLTDKVGLSAADLTAIRNNLLFTPQPNVDMAFQVRT